MISNNCLLCAYSYYDDFKRGICCLKHRKDLCPTFLDDKFRVHYGTCKDFLEDVL